MQGTLCSTSVLAVIVVEVAKTATSFLVLEALNS